MQHVNRPGKAHGIDGAVGVAIESGSLVRCSGLPTWDANKGSSPDARPPLSELVVRAASWRGAMEELTCSFCGRSAAEVAHLIGWSGAATCDDCVWTCLRLIPPSGGGEPVAVEEAA
jgi:ClpX C4-type zinc finger